MVGNDPFCDVAGAHAAGMNAYYIRSALSPRDAPAPEDCGAEYFLAHMDLRALQKSLLA